MPAGVSSHVRSGSSVAGRSRGRRPSASPTRRDGRERLAAAQRLGADEVQAEVAVAEREPVLAAERRGALQRLPRLAGTPPAALLVVEAGQRVEHRVEVRRHVHAEHLDVVAHVADAWSAVRVGDLHEAPQEAGTADAAREDGDPHAASSASTTASACAGRAVPDAVEVVQLSTSSARFGITAATRAGRAARGSAPRCPGRRRGAKSRGLESASAFVVPSRASTSASPPGGAAARRARGRRRGAGKVGVHHEAPGPLDEREAGGHRRALPAARIGDDVPRPRPRRRPRGATRSVRPTARHAASTSSSIASASSRRAASGSGARRSLAPAPRKGTTIPAIGVETSGVPALDNGAIADRLDAFAALLELSESGGYPARAYRRAAETIRSTPAPVAELVRAGRARELRGIGPGIDARLRELVETGEIAELAELERVQAPELVARRPAARAQPRSDARDRRGAGRPHAAGASRGGRRGPVDRGAGHRPEDRGDAARCAGGARPATGRGAGSR